MFDKVRAVWSALTTFKDGSADLAPTGWESGPGYETTEEEE